MKIALILIHRYLGIAISLLFVTWFASGIVMIYTGGMPVLSAQQRLEHLAAIDFSAIQITPGQAAKLARSDLSPKLLMFLNRPVYRFEPDFAGGSPMAVFADTGNVMASAAVTSVAQIVSQFHGIDQSLISPPVQIVEVDQWTIGLRRELPLEKVTLDDSSGTQVYVSLKKGEVVLSTTARQRALAWIGAIPHWLYFLPLRKNTSLWAGVVIWLSTIGCVLAVLGLTLAITQFKPGKPFSVGKSIPYRGLIRWHYILGLVFGAFTLTWVFSGLLSMEPYTWSNARGLSVPPRVFSGGLLDLSQYEEFTEQSQRRVWQEFTAAGELKEIEFVRIQDRHYYLLHQQKSASQQSSTEKKYAMERVLLPALAPGTQVNPFSLQSILARLEGGIPQWPVVSQQLLTEYDSYYYSQNSTAPLPVLRVKFNDPAKTWYYIDPDFSEVVGQSHRLGRLERWLYNGLHSLDFSFWYSRRPFWDIGMIVLILGGLALSSIGLFLGIKRIFLVTLSRKPGA